MLRPEAELSRLRRALSIAGDPLQKLVLLGLIKKLEKMQRRKERRP